MNEHLKCVSADIQMISARIGDDISRQIFENRLMMTFIQNKQGDDKIAFLRKKRDKDKRLRRFFDEIRGLNGDILIYGAGECGRYIYGSKFMDGIPVRGFIDNREWDKGTICDLPVYQFKDAVKNYEKANIILSMESDYSRQKIKEQVAGAGIGWKITDVGEILQEIDKEGLLEIDDPYYRYSYDMVNTSSMASELFDRIRKAVRPIACWITYKEGDGLGRQMKEKWGSYPWCCYLVSDAKQKKYNGIPVYTYDEAVVQYGKFDIIIESESERETARKRMSSLAGKCIDINDVIGTLYQKQYFDFFKYTGEKESFVDGGVLDLGSTKRFMEWCSGNYGRIFAFEPDKSNYELCKEKAYGWDNVSLFHCGLFDRRGKMGFASGLGGTSRIEDQEQGFYSDCNIEVTDLDSVVREEKVTFIKMDIEGAEEKALLGAKRIITQQKPKLAICVYHKPEDIIEIPALVLQMRPDYNIAFRHYSLRATETVMYAW